MKTNIAKKLLNLLNTTTLHALADAGFTLPDLMEATAELERYTDADQNVYVRWNPNDKVSSIKAVRIVGGMGLKEAKDLVDRHQQYIGTEWIGPVVTAGREGIHFIQSELLKNNGAADVKFV